MPHENAKNNVLGFQDFKDMPLVSLVHFTCLYGRSLTMAL